MMTILVKIGKEKIQWNPIREEHCSSRWCTPHINLSPSPHHNVLGSILWHYTFSVLPQHEGGDGKKGAKLVGIHRSNLELVELAWVHKPMPNSMPILWVIKICQNYLTQKSIKASWCDFFVIMVQMFITITKKIILHHCWEKILQEQRCDMKSQQLFLVEMVYFYTLH